MTATQPPTVEAVLADITEMVLEVLADYDPGEVEITADTTFHEDLGLESIDLVTIGSMISERYGDHVNLAEFLAEKELDDVIGMRIGLLVDFVVAATGARAEG
jgi:acyl carrier protein